MVIPHFIADEDVIESIRLYSNGVLVNPAEKMNVPIIDHVDSEVIKQL